MSTGISANRLEILQIADAVAREKSIEKEIVIQAMEHALQKAARSRYGAEHDIRATIDPKTGEMELKRVMTVVDDSVLDPETRPFNPSTDLMLNVALKSDKKRCSARNMSNCCRRSSSGASPRKPPNK